MPFLEVAIFDQHKSERPVLAQRLTDAVAEAFGIEPDIISIYFTALTDQDYAHAGVHAPGTSDQRILVKLHAFRRDVAKRRAVASAMTNAIASTLGTRPENIAVYFLDRDPDEVAHAGALASD